MSETLFDGFEKMGKKQNKEQVPPPAEPESKKTSSRPSKKSQTSSPATSATRKTLEDAFKTLDVGDLKQQLAQSQTLFPENPSVWVKDLAGYLNLHLTAPESEPTLSSYAHGSALWDIRPPSYAGTSPFFQSQGQLWLRATTGGTTANLCFHFNFYS
ncbi:transmembrane protein 214-like [Etheostoma cragini]|uniref:transmembrane protein 214-like n=1 Tax=Etheostoma cragini TaxID=417921 RepID=UPI00155F1BAD|nr:transmembrane protein 214-like [Etheostoma cragini]